MTTELDIGAVILRDRSPRATALQMRAMSDTCIFNSRSSSIGFTSGRARERGPGGTITGASGSEMARAAVSGSTRPVGLELAPLGSEAQLPTELRRRLRDFAILYKCLVCSNFAFDVF